MRFRKEVKIIKYISQNDFYLQTVNKSIDVDHAYGAQCVDLWNYFNKIVNDGIYISSGQQGLAYGIFENRNSNKSLTYFDVVSLNQLQDGDWCFWGLNSKVAPFSHLAMFRKDNGNKTGIFLGQNQGAKVVNQTNLPYEGIIGVFRPKIYNKTTVLQPVVTTSNIQKEATKYGMKVATTLPTGTSFYLSEYASIYGGASYKKAIPDKIKKATTKYTSGGQIDQYGDKWVLAKEIKSWVLVKECLIK